MEGISKVRVLHRRSSSIALLLGAAALSPSLAFEALGSFSGMFGCHIDSDLSTGCIIGDRDYAILMDRLGPYANLSVQVFQYWLAFTLIWIALGLHEARRVSKTVAIAIGGASTIVATANELLWIGVAQYGASPYAIGLFQVALRWMVPLGVFVALASFALRNGFETPQQDPQGVAA